eukprot:TRINITY_DN9088_c0_g1_i2.p1 TRINITY_DN9088_c0_g1~~TRINITY_DN9088_c0_g1_i2.p1  ORF type:complete len:231 (+),score=42.52 TRINITY_DN9088_c0_g1_i2:199-891(+)
MWRDVVKDANITGLVDLQLNSKLESMERDGDRWSLKLSSGRKLVGFKDVVLALPSYASAKLLSNPLHKFLLEQISYLDTYLTLHSDAENTVGLPHFSKADESVKYFVDESQMTGKIGRIFHNDTSNLLLTVHEKKTLIDESKIKTQYLWSHHHFSIWELAIARKIVPFFNSQNGVHLAGDWVFGVGHEDAIKSGVASACAVGVRPRLPEESSAEPLYHKLIERVCTESRH